MPRLARRAYRKKKIRNTAYTNPADTMFPAETALRRKKPRSAKQRANDRRLGRMAKARAAMKKRLVARRRR